MSQTTHHQASVPPFTEGCSEAELLRNIGGYVKAVSAMNVQDCTRYELALREQLATITEPEQGEVLSSLKEILKLGNSSLTCPTLAALGNLGEAATSAVPLILAEGLKDDQELLMHASQALGNIPGQASVLALVDLCEASSDYLTLLEHTLTSLFRHGHDAAPFLARVEDALSAHCSFPRSAYHVPLLNRFRQLLRDDRAREHQHLVLPGEIPLNRIVSDTHSPISELLSLDEKQPPQGGEGRVKSRFRFTLAGSKGEIGVEIHPLQGATSRHLVLLMEDEFGFGMPIDELVPSIAAVITAQYGLDPHTTRWATVATRESGLSLRGHDEYILYNLTHEQSCERYTQGRMFRCASFDELLMLIERMR